MCVPTSEVGYTSAMPRREDHEVHKDMWGHWGGKKKSETEFNTFSMTYHWIHTEIIQFYTFGSYVLFFVVHFIVTEHSLGATS